VGYVATGVAIQGRKLAPSSPPVWLSVLYYAVLLGMLIVGIIGVVFVYRLAKALGRTAWVYAVAALFPCISLITLLIINYAATQTLRQAGIHVGLMGARRADLERLAAELASNPPG